MKRWLIRMENKEIKKKVEAIQKEKGNFFGDKTKIADLARSFGFFVGQAPLEDGTEGIIIVDEATDSLLDTNKNKVIVVDQNVERPRQRFIIAHELGHYILRDSPGEPVFAMRETAHGRNDKENEADYFAACILMPSKEFLSSLQKWCTNLDMPTPKKLRDNDKYKLADILSKQYEVPQLAALRRINEVLTDED